MLTVFSENEKECRIRLPTNHALNPVGWRKRRLAGVGTRRAFGCRGQGQNFSTWTKHPKPGRFLMKKGEKKTKQAPLIFVAARVVRLEFCDQLAQFAIEPGFRLVMPAPKLQGIVADRMSNHVVHFPPILKFLCVFPAQQGIAVVSGKFEKHKFAIGQTGQQAFFHFFSDPVFFKSQTRIRPDQGRCEAKKEQDAG